MKLVPLNHIGVATPSPDELLVGLISLGLVPWIAWTLRRGLASGRLPVGRGYVVHAERPGAFGALIVLNVFRARYGLDRARPPHGRRAVGLRWNCPCVISAL